MNHAEAAAGRPASRAETGLVYRVVVAVVCGVIALWANLHAVDFGQFPEFRVSVLFGLLFPLAIALAWGWRYGLICALSGGTSSLLWIWRSDGYGVVYPFAAFTLWIVWHGYWADRRRRGGRRWCHSGYVMEAVFRLAVEPGYYTIFPWLVSLNPPPWLPTATMTTVTPAWSHAVVIKHVVTGYALLLICDALLATLPVRRFLNIRDTMAERVRAPVMGVALLLGLGMWVLHTAMDAAVFRPQLGSFRQLLAETMPLESLFARGVFLVTCLVVGLVFSRLLTKRTEAEMEAKRERDLANSIVEHGPVGIVIVDTQGAITTANRRAEEALGLCRSEISGRAYNAPEWRITDAEGNDFPEDQLPVHRVLDTGKPVSGVEHAIEWPDGERRLFRINAAPLEDSQGRVERIVCSIEDITTMRETEAELRESEERFRSYVEQAPYGVFITDNAGHYLDANPAASRITGYTRDELLAMGIPDLVPPDGQEDGAAHFARVVEQGFADGVVPFVHKDGTRRLWNVTAVRLNEERILGFVMDVTKREQMEEQIRKSQKLDAVGQLAGGVAHDFNNLLMGIMGYVELCRDGVAEKHPIHEWLDEITHEAERSAGIVRQLLAFSRKQTIAPRVLDLDDTVANMLKMLHRLIGEDIDLMWKPGTDLRPVRMDPGQVDQILANLCVNARDAIGGVGKITIETANVALDADYCATHAETTPGDYVMLAVSDNGCGMDTETLANVFEPFFTTKEAAEGTGLGLATVYGIVKQNGGSVSVYSEPGEGSTFRIYLPCIAATAQDASAPDLSGDVRGGSETILVVDDEKSIRLTTSLFLGNLGYTVLAAETPAEALEMVAEHDGRIDLLVTDVVMPGMNGRQLAEKFEATQPGLRVLYVSGYTANVIAHRGILEEGVQFMSKPITRDELARKVRAVLDGE